MRSLRSYDNILVVEELGGNAKEKATEMYLLPYNNIAAANTARTMFMFEADYENERGNLDKKTFWGKHASCGKIYRKDGSRTSFAMKKYNSLSIPKGMIIQTDYPLAIRVESHEKAKHQDAVILFDELLRFSGMSNLTPEEKIATVNLWKLLLRDIPEEEEHEDGVSVYGLLTLVSRGAIEVCVANDILAEQKADATRLAGKQNC